MAIIKTVLPEDAMGEVAEIYGQVKNTIGFIPNSFILLSTNPFILRQQWEYIGSFLTHKTISNELTAAIRMLVSQTTGCNYCIDINAGICMQRTSPDTRSGKVSDTYIGLCRTLELSIF